MSSKTPLWRPPASLVENCNLKRFMDQVNQRFGKQFSQYNEFWEWSVNNIADFWGTAWDFFDIIHSQKYDQVVDDPAKMPGAKWFEGARLNFAENLLRYRDQRTALIFQGEGQPQVKLTYAELYDQVARMQRALKKAGVQKGDRVAGFMPNMPQTIIAMLAATSLGAIWSSSSPDFGIKGVLDRFGQIEPKVLFTADGYFYGGKSFDSLERVGGILHDLPMVQKVVVVPYVNAKPDISALPNAVHWADFIGQESGLEVEFEQLPAEHPLYIMYSSGTTGKPKCMVQSHVGILMNQLKEHILHCNLSREDVLFYFTTCGWMMWNWLVCGLGVGATLVLYDGSPFHPGPNVLWQLAQDVGMTIFGTSARYITALDESKVTPGKDFDLSRLRLICSTGSPLPKSGFEYVYREVKKDLQLASISGGTDLNGCFCLGCPLLPVHSGELQCRGLALKVFAYGEEGKPVYDQTGELVCAAPFPSMPIYFWNDPDGKRYQGAYFERYPGIWTHGDFIEVCSDTGGVVIYGRSDATLNPGGVRIGTADIYTVVETIPEVADSVVVGQDWHDDVRVVLFVKMAPGFSLDEALAAKIKKAIRSNTSPRHVPAKVLEVKDIPYTINMKKVELAVRNVIHGKPVTNRDALANPDCLDQYANRSELAE